MSSSPRKSVTMRSAAGSAKDQIAGALVLGQRSKEDRRWKAPARRASAARLRARPKPRPPGDETAGPAGSAYRRDPITGRGQAELPVTERGRKSWVAVNGFEKVVLSTWVGRGRGLKAASHVFVTLRESIIREHPPAPGPHRAMVRRSAIADQTADDGCEDSEMVSPRLSPYRIPPPASRQRPEECRDQQDWQSPRPQRGATQPSRRRADEMADSGRRRHMGKGIHDVSRSFWTRCARVRQGGLARDAG